MKNLKVVGNDHDKDILDKATAERKIFLDAEKIRIAELHDFYTVKLKEKGGLDDIVIDKVKLVERLVKMGFCRFDTDDDKYLMVHIKNNTIKRVNATIIRDAFFDWVDNLDDYKYERKMDGDIFRCTIKASYIKSKLFRSIETYFNNMIFERSRSKEKIEIKKDTLDTKFFYFKNCYVSINADGFKTHDYTTLDQYVWETSILQRDFEYTELKGNFETFAGHLAGDDETRKKSLMSLAGYLLHSFFNYKTFLILFCDEASAANGEPNGRTGKTLFFKGLGKMLNATDDQRGYTEIDGKTFKSHEERKYQRADIDTSLIHINDIMNWFGIDSLFTDITEGIIIRQMYEKPFTIFAKLAMSSNKTVKLDGISAKDRVIVFEVHNYYDDKKNPQTEFNEWFFRDWEALEWNKFFSYIIRCFIVFFKNGIIKPAEINYSKRIIQDHTAPEFFSWFEDEFNYILAEMMQCNNHVQKCKKILWNKFLEDYPDYKNNKRFSQNKFTVWIRSFLKLKGYTFEEVRKGTDVFIIHNPKIDPEKDSLNF